LDLVLFNLPKCAIFSETFAWFFDEIFRYGLDPIVIQMEHKQALAMLNTVNVSQQESEK